MANVIAFDLDGTLTIDSNTDQEDLVSTFTCRTPNPKTIAVLKKAIANGWTVVIYTGRKEGMRRLTENWLDLHGVPYHMLVMNKCYYKYLIDDRARTVDEIERLLDK